MLGKYYPKSGLMYQRVSPGKDLMFSYALAKEVIFSVWCCEMAYVFLLFESKDEQSSELVFIY